MIVPSTTTEKDIAIAIKHGLDRRGMRRQFVPPSQRTPAYNAAVSSLSKLADTADLDTATRASADASSWKLLLDFAQRYDVKRSNKPCIDRLVTQDRCHCFDRYPLYRARHNPPGDDHPTLWLKEGKPFIYTNEPYVLDKETIAALPGFCEAYGLSVDISTESMYFPGHAFLLMYYRKSSL